MFRRLIFYPAEIKTCIFTKSRSRLIPTVFVISLLTAQYRLVMACVRVVLSLSLWIVAVGACISWGRDKKRDTLEKCLAIDACDDGCVPCNGTGCCPFKDAVCCSAGFCCPPGLVNKFYHLKASLILIESFF